VPSPEAEAETDEEMCPPAPLSLSPRLSSSKLDAKLDPAEVNAVEARGELPLGLRVESDRPRVAAEAENHPPPTAPAEAPALPVRVRWFPGLAPAGPWPWRLLWRPGE